MAAVIYLLILVALLICIVRIATVSLSLTGLSLDVARFQARSALSGTGFTTQEAELVVNHPVRRKIISILIIFQAAGIVTAITALILAFVNTGTPDAIKRGGLLLGGLVLLYLGTRSKTLEKSLSRAVEWALRRHTRIDVTDYHTLLNLEKNFEVAKITVEERTWLANRKVSDLCLAEEGIAILGIRRNDGSYCGVPRGKYSVYPGDMLILYGKQDVISAIKDRSVGIYGEKEHEEAKQMHEEELVSQDRYEEEYEQKIEVAK
jgi:hypothetical protein